LELLGQEAIGTKYLIRAFIDTIQAVEELYQLVHTASIQLPLIQELELIKLRT